MSDISRYLLLDSIQVNITESNKLELILPVEKETQLEEQNSDEQGDRENYFYSHDDKKNISQIHRKSHDRVATLAYQEGNYMIIEDQDGEVMRVLPVKDTSRKNDSDTEKVYDSREETNNAKDKYKFNLRRSSETDKKASHSYDSVLPSSSSSSSASSISSESLKINEKSQQHTKPNKPQESGSKSPAEQMYAHQIDNLIVLENGDGEIIRRYKVKRINSKNQSKPKKFKLITQKALRKVGFHSNDENPDSTTQPSNDLEKTESENILVKDYDLNSDKSPLRNTRVEGKVEESLRNIINQEHKKSGVARLFGRREEGKEKKKHENEIKELAANIERSQSPSRQPVLITHNQ